MWPVRRRPDWKGRSPEDTSLGSWWRVGSEALNSAGKGPPASSGWWGVEACPWNLSPREGDNTGDLNPRGLEPEAWGEGGNADGQGPLRGWDWKARQETLSLDYQSTARATYRLRLRRPRSIQGSNWQESDICQAWSWLKGQKDTTNSALKAIRERGVPGRGREKLYMVGSGPQVKKAKSSPWS